MLYFTNILKLHFDEYEHIQADYNKYTLPIPVIYLIKQAKCSKI